MKFIGLAVWGAALGFAATPGISAAQPGDLPAFYQEALSILGSEDEERSRELAAEISTAAADIRFFDERAQGLSHRANLLRQRTYTYKPGEDMELGDDARRTASELAVLAVAADYMVARVARFEASALPGDFRVSWAADNLWHQSFLFHSKAFMIAGEALLAKQAFEAIGMDAEGWDLDAAGTALLAAANRLAYRARALLDKARR